MPKDKHKKGDRKKKKAGKNTSQLSIRLDKAERDAFVDLCKALDTSATREIHRFMRDFVASHSASQVPQAEADVGPAKAEAEPPASEAPAPMAETGPKRKSASAKAPAEGASAKRTRISSPVKKAEAAPPEKPAPAGRRPRRAPRAKAAE